MSQNQNGKDGTSNSRNEEDLEQLLSQGITFHEELNPTDTQVTASQRVDDEEDTTLPAQEHLQLALAIFAEAAQDMATAAVELSLGRHFACADFCNQVAEKSVQAVSVLRFGRRTAYDHDLHALGSAVGAPKEIQDEMAILTPFHPETFYADTPPEEADEVINAEQASTYIQHARTVMRWARNIVLHA